MVALSIGMSRVRRLMIQKTDCPRPGMSTVGVECVDWQQLEPDPALLGDLIDLVN
jgi:hypothetical protein